MSEPVKRHWFENEWEVGAEYIEEEHPRNCREYVLASNHERALAGMVTEREAVERERKAYLSGREDVLTWQGNQLDLRYPLPKEDK